MIKSEAFITVNAPSSSKAYDAFEEHLLAHAHDRQTSIEAILRRQCPELNITTVSDHNVPSPTSAAAGNATAELDLTTESVQRIRWFYFGDIRTPSELAESRLFAKYHYKWADEDFIRYIINMGYNESYT